MLSTSIAASTASWIELTAPEWPRAKAIRSWFASSAAPRRRRSCATARSSKGITVAIMSEIRPRRLISYHQGETAACRELKTKAAASFDAAARKFPLWELFLARRQVVRHVVERRVQLVADALHRANRRNGDESGDQTVLDRGRTLVIPNQLQKLAHGLRSLVPSSDGEPS